MAATYVKTPGLITGAAKAATMNYVKSLAKQLAVKGIRVIGVVRGPI